MIMIMTTKKDDIGDEDDDEEDQNKVISRKILRDFCHIPAFFKNQLQPWKFLFVSRELLMCPSISGHLLVLVLLFIYLFVLFFFVWTSFFIINQRLCLLLKGFHDACA